MLLEKHNMVCVQITAYGKMFTLINFYNAYSERYEYKKYFSELKTVLKPLKFQEPFKHQ